MTDITTGEWEITAPTLTQNPPKEAGQDETEVDDNGIPAS